MITEDTMKQLIRDIPDFPSDGILFRDITPVLQTPKAFHEVICSMVECAKPMKPDVIVGSSRAGSFWVLR